MSPNATPQLPNEILKMIVKETLYAYTPSEHVKFLRNTRRLASANKTFATLVCEDLGPAAQHLITKHREAISAYRARYPRTHAISRRYHAFYDDLHCTAKSLHGLKRILDHMAGRNISSQLRDRYSKNEGWRRIEKRSKPRIKATKS